MFPPSKHCTIQNIYTYIVLFQYFKSMYCLIFEVFNVMNIHIVILTGQDTMQYGGWLPFFQKHMLPPGKKCFLLYYTLKMAVYFCRMHNVLLPKIMQGFQYTEIFKVYFIKYVLYSLMYHVHLYHDISVKNNRMHILQGDFHFLKYI